MQVSYNWLKDYVDLTDISPEKLADLITKAGIEVEHVHYLGEGIKGVVVGYVESCTLHPNADKLNVCQVNLGSETVQIICGAPNVAAGQTVAVARAGAVLPGHFKIKKAKLRGEESNGMICSLGELGVDQKLVPKEYANGIYVLDEEAIVGEDALPYLNLDDAVLELDILPNSAHCMNMIGVAYEVGAILDRPVHIPEPIVKESDVSAHEKIRVNVDAKDGVPFYSVRMIEGVKIGPSPRWLQNRLIACGIRPISNVVDITNYVMLEYGQPLHAFDFRDFGTDEVVVRKAQPNEKMVTLDDQERDLEEYDLLITNGERPMGLAGVMGGANSEVKPNTETILLESAIFDSRTIRKTSTRLQLRTDASSRYEKGIDRNRAVPAANRAAELMSLYANGTVLKGVVHEGDVEVPPTRIELPVQKINQVLGTDLETDVIVSVLKRLGFGVTLNGELLSVEVPARRPDVIIPEDLVEEVGRIYGYDHVPATLPKGTSAEAGLNPYQVKRRQVERYMTGAGLSQAVTYSLTSEERLEMIAPLKGEGVAAVRLAMPMSEDRNVLRKSLLPELLQAVTYHLNRQMPNVFLYEMGHVFIKNEGEANLPDEREYLSGALTGIWEQGGWQGPSQKVDFYVAKGVLDGLFERLGVASQIAYQPTEHKGLHPGRTASILLGETAIGIIGQVHPELQSEWDLNDTVVYECDLTALLEAELEPLTFVSLPRYPSITRDIALVVEESVQAGVLRETILNAGGDLLKEATLFDLYKGEHLEPGKKSLAYSLRYYNPEKTLTDEEVTAVHEKVLQAVYQAFGATLRG
ncbi:phenylalanine--tRNA ligase subunit beta [Pullulanibacillus sp. KACC 23026]|uniref:phenylalanine--tRNA ligase subunit beta n=1 Tax=Pullulanibacillus sp. KACC 23026 TaxID=3028315 RepID=UPI0023B00C9D|nr:phenylalanine--tRNA ligase subunit beta [Pullulanibacillus sp. KACC 23026]WEG13927.1 phenylalanine--tRNA ligase subunit beta [Pullulanibacillus sp. KACC 23026]